MTIEINTERSGAPRLPATDRYFTEFEIATGVSFAPSDRINLSVQDRKSVFF